MTAKTLPLILLAAALAAAPRAGAVNILRRQQPAAPVTPADADAAAAAAAAAAASAAAARQADSPLRRALDGMRRWHAGQDAARAAAQAAASQVPNGLGPGGLQLADDGPLIGANAPAQSAQAGRTEVTISQTDQRAILTWTKFNVGKETDVHFDQTAGGDNAASWVALNRVVDPSAAPSQILGSIRAEGQVYLINRNGILFGGSSQVNVGTLVASGLDIAGDTLEQRNQKFLSSSLIGLSWSGPGGSVTVEPGARISVAPFGRALLYGTEVINRGSLEAPDGQVMLAAGSSITAGSADLTAVRGLSAPLVTGTGLVENAGLISTPRGNITLVAPETRQNGLLQATTGAEANGSILIGADGFTATFGPGSSTQILPDLDGKKVIGAGTFKPSRIDVRGDKITLLDGATIYAPSGDVSLSAVMVSDPTGAGLDDTRVYLAAGATVDVSGLRGVEVAMEQNSIRAELRANELRDNPLLRNSPGLRGRSAYFDGRLGVLGGVADLSGYYDLIERDVTQVMVSGGTVNIAGAEVIARAGSRIDLSGGSLRYRDGYVRSSLLVDRDGRRVRIEDALAGVQYVGMQGDAIADHTRWGVVETFASSLGKARPRFEAGYEQGASAGTLSFSVNDPLWYSVDPNAPKPPSPSSTGAALILDGAIAADVVAGPKQREAPTGSIDPTRVWREQPRGGSLDVQRAGEVTIGAVGTQLGGAFDAGSALDPRARHQVLLSSKLFDGAVFQSVAIKAGFDPNEVSQGSGQTPGDTNSAPGGHLAIGSGVVVDLGDGGQFSFVGKGVQLDGAIRAAGGAVNLEALQSGGDAARSATIRVGGSGRIDVAGRVSNDHLDGAGAPLRPINGGSISLAAANVLLDRGSLLDASGGLRVNAAGTRVTAGNGGSIKLDTSRPQTPSLPVRQPVDGNLVMAGELRGYAPGAGGALTIVTGQELVIGDRLPAGASDHVRLFTPDFFNAGGFSAFTLVGERGVTVTRGTLLAPAAQSLSVPDRPGDLPTGTLLADVASRIVLPQELRPPMSITLSTLPARPVLDTQSAAGPLGNVTLEEGAALRLSPRSRVALAATGLLEVDGAIEAAGGSISLAATDLGLQNPVGAASIVLGGDARLLAGGYQAESLEGGIVRRSVAPGGQVSIAASVSVDIAPTAVIDVAGLRGIADLPAAANGQGRFEARTVDGSAGSISIAASTGLIAGDLRLRGGGDTGLAGSLSIAKAGRIVGPMVVRQDLLTEHRPDGPLTVIANSIDVSGAGDLTLKVSEPNASDFADGSAIIFDGSVDLRTSRSITLLSPILGTQRGPLPASVTIWAPYVQLHGAGGSLKTASATDLDGTLEIRASLIDVSNQVVLGCTSGAATCKYGGFSVARFESAGDLRLSDHDVFGNSSPNAGLLSSGALDLVASQVYVTTREQSVAPANLERADSDPGFLVSSADRITVGRPDGAGSTAVPFSFGERMTLRAPRIEQGGVLRAPLGQIHLEGTGPDAEVRLLPGSLTSVSLEGGMVPFGAVLTGGIFPGYDRAGQAPTKSVRLSASSVVVEKDAVVDVSGGGDLVGYLSVPGNGGSRDILSSSGGFAVLPSLGTQPAPVGGIDALRDPRLRTGDSIWLQGVPGLADGTYTVLPAHYALLPGGIFVQPQGGSFASAAPATIRPDGAILASGYRTLSGAPGFGRYVVMPRSVFGRYSELIPYSFSAGALQLADQADLTVRTPIDAGSVVLDASKSLVLQGTGRFGAGAGGLAGNLDISAPKIAVVSGGSAAPDPSYLQLDPEALRNFGAASVLIGGIRSSSAAAGAPTGTAVAVKASDVLVATDDKSPLSGSEIILAATRSVTVADGSVLRAEGPAVADSSPLLLSGDGALLRLSTGGRVPLSRQGSTGAAGALLVGDASLSAESLTFDGAKSVALSAGATFSSRQFDLASVRINLGQAPADAPGVTLTPDALSRFGAGSDLLLRGYGSIDFYGDLALGGRASDGSAGIKSITLDTGLLQGHGDASLTAGTLRLKNSGGGSTGSQGGFTLTLDVDALDLGPGQVQVAGFDAVYGTAGVVEAQGTGGLSLQGSLSLATDLIRASSATSYFVDAGGDVVLTRAGFPAAPAAKGLGAAFTVRGFEVFLDTSVVLPAGSFEAAAKGGAVVVGDSASIDVRGAGVDLGGQELFAPGGSIRLSALTDLSIAAGAALDVSGAARGGAAGSISLIAGFDASVLGSLRGTAAAGSRGGSFSLDAGTYATDFAALNETLNANGFDAFRGLRLRLQDLTIGAGERIAAHEVVLRSDSGRVTVAGEIAAGGNAADRSGGRIEISGGAGVAIEAGARLDAHAAPAAEGGFEPASGRVEIAASGGTVDVAPGSFIDLSGGRSGGGALVVRAPRLANDVAIDRLAPDLVGARELIVQGLQGYEASVVDAALAARVFADASSWWRGSAPQVQARLGGQGVQLLVAPAISVTSSGDLSVRTDLDLSSIAGGAGTPGFLGLTAGRDLLIGFRQPDGSMRGSISDGFAGASREAALLDGRSFSYRLESGNDLIVQPSALVRTGTGGIAMLAGRDLKLSEPARSTDLGAVVYTAGRRADTPGYAAPPGAIAGEFPIDGGDLELKAGRDVLAPFSTQSISAWLFRYGDTDWGGDAASSRVKQQASWSIVFRNFEQGVGALGGGDVHVSAGRDVSQLSVAIPTTGFSRAAVGAAPVADDLVVRGGGDLSLDAGRDLAGGLLLLGRGQGSVHAGGSIRPSDRLVGLRSAPDTQVLGPPRPVGLLLGLMDATADLSASGDLFVEGAFDPMRQGQIRANLIGGTGSAFSSYSERAALSATSFGGAVTYENDPWASVDLTLAGKPAFQVPMGSGSGGAGAGSLNELFSHAPPTLRLTALEGDVLVRDHFGNGSTLTLAPAARGQLELLAGSDVRIALGNLTMNTLPRELRHGALVPFATNSTGTNLGTNSTVFFPPIHLGDEDPVLVRAGGSVCAQRSGSCTLDTRSLPSQLSLPKAVDVQAGLDVLSGNWQWANVEPGALSRIVAGRDLHELGVQASGEGSALLEAGRNVVLNQYATRTKGGSIVSTPDRTTGRLKGTSIFVLAGAAGGVDWDGFAALYLDPVNAKGVPRTYLPELRDYLGSLGIRPASDADLLAAFLALPPSRRQILLERIYFEELKQTGIDYNDASSPRHNSYDRGFAAISALFPNGNAQDRPHAGDVLLNGRPLETQAEGDIDVLAPYGRIAVGAEVLPAGVDPSAGGIVTRRGGGIRLMADGNIDLFTSRVFTLQGGDVLMWTSGGSITAGAGAKTSVFQRPLSYTINPEGVIAIDAFGLQTGAGIGVLDALLGTESRQRSRLDLIAPRGEVNAGDAGIRVVGDLNIAAQAVVGVENIQVAGGQSTGVPKVETPSLSLVTTANQVAQAATKDTAAASAAESQARARAAADLPSIITLEVIGYEAPTDDERNKK